MRIARIAARVLTGSTYVALGLDAFRVPGGRVQLAGPTLDRLRTVLPLPDDDEALVRLNAAVQVAAGGALIAGVAQRPAALVLIGSLIPTTLAGHAFWAADDPAAHKAQRVQFHKNLALIGGLVFAVLERSQRR
jgi:uncharacterized membrane protein YphA (DoxX/SURF4 family)